MATLLEAESQYQKIKIKNDTLHPGEIVLYLDDLWQFGSFTEFKYHDCLITIPFCVAPSIDKVLICGGGDGLALRNALWFPNCYPTLVELDPGMLQIFRDMPEYAKYNNNSMSNDRAKVVVRDAISYMAGSKDLWDVVVWDFPSPDPDDDGDINLYTVENVRKAINILKPQGVLAMQTSVSTMVLCSLAKELKSKGFNLWHYECYYDKNGSLDQFLVASRVRLRQERLVPERARFANNRRIAAAFSKSTEIVPEDFEYFTHFLHMEEVEQEPYETVPTV